MGRRRLARLALAAVAAAVALLFVEAALRLVGFSYPNFYEPDRARGWALRPGEEAWWRREGEALVRINAHGQRDAERSLAKRPGTWRLAVLGDSVVEALQVPLEQTFPHLLEERLEASCPALAGRRVEVLNFGVSGYGTAQELLTFTERARAFAPDAVLLVFFAGNDVANNLEALDGNATRPYFVRGEDGRLRLDTSFRDEPGFRLRERLGLAYALANRSRVLQLAKAAAAAWRARSRGAAGADPFAEVGLEEPVFRPPADARWAEAWQVTGALLAALAREAGDAGARFGVAAASVPLQVHPEAEVRRRARERIGVADLDEPDRRLAAIGARQGFPVLALARPLRERAERSGAFFHGFPNTLPGTGHWNAAGHEAAAELLAPWVCDELVRPSGGRGKPEAE